jgi:hypothetical protein
VLRVLVARRIGLSAGAGQHFLLDTGTLCHRAAGGAGVLASRVAIIAAGSLASDRAVKSRRSAQGSTARIVSPAPRRLSAPAPEQFVVDSPLEGTGFEPSVPRGKGPTLRVSVLFHSDFSVSGNQPEAT